MTPITGAPERSVRRPATSPQAVSSLRFDWVVILVSIWFLGGLFLDGWAHTHGKVDESFFTPWHGVLYTGHLVTLVVLGAQWLRQGGLPAAYLLSLGGALLFAIGGVGDLIWHELFGIEENIEALLSPTHLLLAVGLTLVVSGPLRAAWQRSPANLRTLPEQAPMLISAAFLLSMLTFFTQFAHPVANLWGIGAGRAPEIEQELGVTSILLDTTLLMGLTLLLMRHWQLVPGALTLIFTVNAGLMGFLFDQGSYPLPHLVVRIAAGLIADLLLAHWRPSAQRLLAWRGFAFVTPAALYLIYFGMAHVVAGIAWSIHMWTGVAVLAGGVGFLLSFLVLPPVGDEVETR
jgi:hypothetical protein